MQAFQSELEMVRNRNNLVILNQASNYLTIGFANSFNERFENVVLITGSIHSQGEELDGDIEVTLINKWCERPTLKKVTSYALALARMWLLLITKYRHHEVLFVSVPPMGYLLNLVLPHRFSMVIWDVYPDVLKISGTQESDLVYRVWAALNRSSFRKAWRIFTISEPMAEMLETYVDRRRLIVEPIWSIFQENARVSTENNPFVEMHGLRNKFVVQYSGNIGVTHNVEVLVDVAERLKDENSILFQIIGRGPRQLQIERIVKKRNLENVQILPFQSDEMFRYSLSAASLGVVVLHESVGRGSVPSKAYNLMSFGIPALYVAAANSELARYADSFGHARCFSAEKLDEIAEFVLDLSRDRKMRGAMRRHAEQAAENFRRINADRFVDAYFASQEQSV